MASEVGGSSSGPSWSMKMVISSIKTRFPSVKNMSTDELARALLSHTQEEGTGSEMPKADVLVLDARPPEEFIVSHIRGAVRVDPDGTDTEETMKRIEEEKLTTVVCYCSVGYRSSSYVQALQSAIRTKGLTENVCVYNLEGSLMKWANEGRPMVDMNGITTPYCHPYSAVWGKLLNADLRKTQP